MPGKNIPLDIRDTGLILDRLAANRPTKLQGSPPVRKTRQKAKIFDLAILDISRIGHKRTLPLQINRRGFFIFTSQLVT